ncbi:MAG: SLC13 family permease, partial [Peptococcaceae bacterium]
GAMVYPTVTVVMTPVALMSVLAAPLTQIAVNMDMTAYPVIYTLKHACTTIIFPYENTTFLIAYSFGLIDMKTFMKLMAVMCIAEFIFMLCVGVPFWSFIGLM